MSVFAVHSAKLFQEGGKPHQLDTPKQTGSRCDTGSRTVVASPVVSVTIEGAVISNLSERVIFNFRVNEVQSCYVSMNI